MREKFSPLRLQQKILQGDWVSSCSMSHSGDMRLHVARFSVQTVSCPQHRGEDEREVRGQRSEVREGVCPHSEMSFPKACEERIIAVCWNLI